VTAMQEKSKKGMVEKKKFWTVLAGERGQKKCRQGSNSDEERFTSWLFNRLSEKKEV